MWSLKMVAGMVSAQVRDAGAASHTIGNRIEAKTRMITLRMEA